MKKPPTLVMEPRIRLTCGRDFAFGPGQAKLLEEIAEAGSIAVAARTMKMSYMRAWLLVKRMNQGFAKPLVVTLRGGGLHGGAKLTAAGAKVLKLYQGIDQQSRTAARRALPSLLKLLRP